MFDYTQQPFWRGPWYPYWSLIIISIFGGLFGLDHFWLRSPLTGVLKMIVNIFGLGIWYFYDLLQILGEKESVMKNGLTAPIFGPLGIGAGMFVDNNQGKPLAKSPYRFLAYLILLWLPFGFDFYIAGDSNGAMAKFICTIVPIFWPIAFIWGFVNIVKALFTPKSVFTEGTYRMFPVNWFTDASGPSVLGPVDIPAGSGVCGTGGITGVISSVAGSAVGVIAPGLIPAVGAITGATEAVADGITETATASANAAKEVINSAIKPAINVASTASSVAVEIPAAVQGLHGVGSEITSKLGAVTSNEGLKALAKQSGGGSDFSSLALLLFFTIILGGGTFMAVRRMNLNTSFFIKKSDDKNDAPPESRGL